MHSSRPTALGASATILPSEGDEGKVEVHHDQLATSILPSKWICKTDNGATNIPTTYKMVVRAMCLRAGLRLDASCPQTSGSFNTQMSPSTMPTTNSQASAGSAKTSISPAIAHMCHRGSMSNGTWTPLSTPSDLTKIFWWCVTRAIAKAVDSSPAMQLEMFRKKHTAGMHADKITNSAEYMKVPMRSRSSVYPSAPRNDVTCTVRRKLGVNRKYPRYRGQSLGLGAYSRSGSRHTCSLLAGSRKALYR
mmetsp:Transcript_24866/g.63455  ORF Transcript_24866/g.63455 Transcript_24866/m.63455 type:complete len:249 (+) Transcript_24866:419-1165(+)